MKRICKKIFVKKLELERLIKSPTERVQILVATGKTNKMINNVLFRPGEGGTPENLVTLEVRKHIRRAIAKMPNQTEMQIAKTHFGL